jgi:cation diffusion facilitator CzcD-associated flavoprotein CzcO
VGRADEHVKVVIVGGGFSGVAMAIRLKQRGIENFVVLERAEDIGGTWQQNTYPGCRCDVPSHLYSLSFAPNPDWSHAYSPQEEIRDYLRACAERFGIRKHVRTGVEVDEATWLEEEHRWEIATNRGLISAGLLVNGMGPLTEPRFPDVPGLESFEGKTMHSARWDHDYDLSGKRVASIGTGASAIQYVPQIRAEVERLYVFQRTAPWVMPHNDRPITDLERTLFRRFPPLQRVVRAGIYWGRELMVFGFAKQPRLMSLLERLGRSHMRKQISDAALLEKVTPDYTLGCKRLLPSNDWYRALGEPNVDLVAGGVTEIRERSVVDAHGVEREVDAVIFGTGFHITDAPYAEQIRGRDGKLLSEVWEGSPHAYLGTAVPGFPNLFLLLGANTGLGHGSMVYMIEAQVEHVLRAIDLMERRGGTAIEVSAAAHERFNRAVDARMRRTVWNTGGCSSFYLDVTGRNATQWPDFTWRFRRLAEQVDAGTYVLRTRQPAAVVA